MKCIHIVQYKVHDVALGVFIRKIGHADSMHKCHTTPVRIYLRNNKKIFKSCTEFHMCFS